MAEKKLVETLAEALVDELSRSKTLDLMNDEKFKEFTDLLWEILDQTDKTNTALNDKTKEDTDKDLGDKVNALGEDVKQLAEIIRNYFKDSGNNNTPKNGEQTNDKEKLSIKGSALMNISSQTSKILKIVENLQSNSDKNTKVEKEKKVNAQKSERKSQRMIHSLKRDFNRSERKRDRHDEKVERGLKGINKKLGSLAYKFWNKLKGFLLVGLLLLFAKPIWETLKAVIEPIWTDTIQPKVGKWFNDIKNGIAGAFNGLGKWFADTFPELNDWIKKNWNETKIWFTETFPKLKDALESILNSWVVRQFIEEQGRKEIEKLKKKAEATTDPVEKARLELEMAKLAYEINKNDNDFEDDGEKHRTKMTRVVNGEMVTYVYSPLTGIGGTAWQTGSGYEAIAKQDIYNAQLKLNAAEFNRDIRTMGYSETGGVPKIGGGLWVDKLNEAINPVSTTDLGADLPNQEEGKGDKPILYIFNTNNNYKNKTYNQKSEAVKGGT